MTKGDYTYYWVVCRNVEILCCTLETNMTLYVSFTSVKSKIRWNKKEDMEKIFK